MSLGEQGDVRISARRAPEHCAFCRGALGDPARTLTCACGSVQHDDCRREHGDRCATSGCAGAATPSDRGATRTPDAVRVTARGVAAACAFCRSALDDAARVVTCVCGSVQHDDCLREHGGRCVTVGCPGRASQMAPAADNVATTKPSRSLAATVAPWVIGACGLGAVHAWPWAWLAVGGLVVPWLLRRLAPGRSLPSLLLLGLLLEAGVALSLDLAGMRWSGQMAARDPYFVVPIALALIGLLAAGLVGLAPVAARLAWLAPGERARPGRASMRPSVAPSLALFALVLGGAAARWPDVAQWGWDARAQWRARMGGPEELEALIYDVTDPARGPRMAVDRALFWLDAPDANTTFVELLRHPDKYRRHGAGVALAKNRAKVPSAVAPLVEALQGREPLAVNAAAYALCRYAQELPDACRDAVPALIQRTRYGDAWVRMHCAEALGALREDSAVPALIELLDDDGHGTSDGSGFVAGDNWQQVHLEAREALVKIGSPALEALRLAAESHPRAAVREAAARAVAEITGAPRVESEVR